MRLTGAEALVRCLEAERTSFAFGIVGGKLAPLLHALARDTVDPLRRRAPRGGRADDGGGGVRTHGPMAVALGEMGPGGLNLASGMGVAFNNNLPLLADHHQPASRRRVSARGMFMDLDSRALFAPVTKWNAVVARSAADAGTGAHGVPRSAHRPARAGASGHPAGRAGAVVDFADDEFDVEPSRYARRRRAAPEPQTVSRAARRCCARRGVRDRRRRRGRVASGAERAVRRPGSTARRAGGADADGARRGRDRQPALHRPRRPDRGRRRARRLRAGRRGAERRLPLLVLDVGRARPVRAAPRTGSSTSTSIRRRSARRRCTRWRCRPTPVKRCDDLLEVLGGDGRRGGPTAGCPRCATCVRRTAAFCRRWPRAGRR